MSSQTAFRLVNRRAGRHLQYAYHFRNVSLSTLCYNDSSNLRPCLYNTVTGLCRIYSSSHRLEHIRLYLQHENFIFIIQIFGFSYTFMYTTLTVYVYVPILQLSISKWFLFSEEPSSKTSANCKYTKCSADQTLEIMQTL